MTTYILVVGAGKRWLQIAETLNMVGSDITITLVERNPEKQEQMRQKGYRIFSTVDEALLNGEYSHGMVLTKPESHIAFCRVLIAAGIQKVFTECPLSSPGINEDLSSLLQEKGATLQMGLIISQSEVWQELHKQACSIGDVFRASLTWRKNRLSDVRGYLGCVLEAGVHPLALLCQLIDEVPQLVDSSLSAEAWILPNEEKQSQLLQIDSSIREHPLTWVLGQITLEQKSGKKLPVFIDWSMTQVALTRSCDFTLGSVDTPTKLSLSFDRGDMGFLTSGSHPDVKASEEDKLTAQLRAWLHAEPTLGLVDFSFAQELQRLLLQIENAALAVV